MISVEVVSVSPAPLARVTGRLDAQTAQEFQDAVLSLVGKADHATRLDFSGVEYVSSMGLRAIAVTAKAAARKGFSLRLSDVRPEVYSILRRCGFDTFMEINRHES